MSTLIKQLNPKNTKLNEPLSNHTTLKIGGKADIFYEAFNTQDLINTIKLAKYQSVPVTIIGWGSNILISDKGIRGIVIKNSTKTIKVKGEKPIQESKARISSRFEANKKTGSFKGIEMKDLDYDESKEMRIEVEMDSGVDLPFAIKYLIDHGVTGLQWYAGIPGTIGGAVYNNIHGGTHLLGEAIEKVKVLDKELNIRELKIKDMGFKYDKSRFHKTDEIILTVTFNLFKGDVKKARLTANEWAKRKKIQPRNSAGCTFKNISERQKEKLNLPTTATGYIIEHALNMKGYKSGGASISKDHANFIVNDGNAKAEDYLKIMKDVHKNAYEKLTIKLIPEIILLGFEKEEIKEFI